MIKLYRKYYVYSSTFLYYLDSAKVFRGISNIEYIMTNAVLQHEIMLLAQSHLNA